MSDFNLQSGKGQSCLNQRCSRLDFNILEELIMELTPIVLVNFGNGN